MGATQLELRKLGSERHTLRARLRREADRLIELESALRAEKELRRQASDEHQSTLAGLRARFAELEAARASEVARLSHELEQARAAAARAEAALAAAEARAQDAEQARSASAGPRAASKIPQGLRRIRGIGPAYERLLEQLGVSSVQQIADWRDSDIIGFADKLKIRPERITKDDWVGQAKRLEPE